MCVRETYAATIERCIPKLHSEAQRNAAIDKGWTDGKGDDDQATAGNGHEEGWLTQVVKILQLANPALTAEEAIVRAMGLVSINNQALHGETEKIPKDVSSSIAHIKKLSNSNWHTWEPTFIDCLQRVHNAKEILYDTIAPGNKLLSWYQS
ncbi:uncharacterized protein UDID_17319 [Ustilago sp. UG-2017a]|nr:uncharacterized protein UDID_17319 [Ustilago sp. UG-2017a]